MLAILLVFFHADVNSLRTMLHRLTFWLPLVHYGDGFQRLFCKDCKNSLEAIFVQEGNALYRNVIENCQPCTTMHVAILRNSHIVFT